MMAFVQIIEMTTSNIGDVEALMDEWTAKTEGRRTAHRAVLAEDRDRPGTYVQVVEFSDYDEAMANSALPETSEYAERIAALCDGPPTFRNLSARRVEDLD
jgi:quinol monooxygenase YgiN